MVRVAIVDDDISVCKSLSRLLRASELDTETYESGGAFLASLPAGAPDCVVLDLSMPGMTGIDVLRRLSYGGFSLPVVVVTGHDEPGARAQCFSAGAAAYLCKPFDDLSLLTAITAAIGRAERGH